MGVGGRVCAGQRAARIEANRRERLGLAANCYQKCYRTSERQRRDPSGFVRELSTIMVADSGSLRPARVPAGEVLVHPGPTAAPLAVVAPLGL